MADKYWDGANNGPWGTVANWNTTLSGNTNVTAFPGQAGTTNDVAYFYNTAVNTTRTVKIGAAVPNPISIVLNSNLGVTITDNGTFIYTLTLQDNGSTPAISTGTTTGFINITNLSGYVSVQTNSHITIQPKNAAAYISLAGIETRTSNINPYNDIYVGDSVSGGTLGTLRMSVKPVGYLGSSTSMFGTVYLGRHTTDLPTLQFYGNAFGNLSLYRGNVELVSTLVPSEQAVQVQGNISSTSEDPTSTKLYVRGTPTYIVNPPIFNPSTATYSPSPYSISVPVFVESGVYATAVFPSTLKFMGGAIGIIDPTYAIASGTLTTVYVEDGYDAKIGFGTITTYFGPRTAGTAYGLRKVTAPSDFSFQYGNVTVPVHAGITSITLDQNNLTITGSNVFTSSAPVAVTLPTIGTGNTLDLTSYTGDIYLSSLSGGAYSSGLINTPTRNFYLSGPSTFGGEIVNTTSIAAITPFYIDIPDAGGVTRYLTLNSEKAPGDNVYFYVRQGGLKLYTNSTYLYRVSMEATQPTYLDLTNATASFFALSVPSNATVTLTNGSLLAVGYSLYSVGYTATVTVDGTITAPSGTPVALGVYRGNLTLTQNNTFTRATVTLDRGSLILNGPQTLSSGVLGNLSSYNATIIFNANGTLSQTSANTYDYSRYISASSDQVRIGVTANVSWGTSISVNALLKSGSGTLTLTKDNTLKGSVFSDYFNPIETVLPPVRVYSGALELGSANALGLRNAVGSGYEKKNWVYLSGEGVVLRSDSTTSRTVVKDLVLDIITSTSGYPPVVVYTPATVYLGDTLKSGTLVFSGAFYSNGNTVYVMSPVSCTGAAINWSPPNALVKRGPSTLSVSQLGYNFNVDVRDGVFRVTGTSTWYTSTKPVVRVYSAAQFNIGTPTGVLALQTLVMGVGSTLRVSR